MSPEQRLSMWIDDMGHGAQTKLAKFLGITNVYVNRWIKDEKYSIQPEYYVGIEDFFKKPRGSLIDDNVVSANKVPIFGETSCGDPISSQRQIANKTCGYNGEYWHKDLYCVIACGDSMASEIEDGDEIICDPRIAPQHGDLVHYVIHGESAVKLYIIDEEANIIQFVPYNQSPTFKTKTIRMDDDEISDLKITKVVSVNKLKFNNRLARLKLVGRA